LQYLGRISYSLYLIHTVIGDPIVYYFRQQLVGPVPSAPVGLTLFAAACTVSIVGAHLMYRFIEKPSVELAKRFKMKEPRIEPRPA
jgi:peptidoglycan/LPS O-acetylase OafA/YrhL